MKHPHLKRHVKLRCYTWYKGRSVQELHRKRGGVLCKTEFYKDNSLFCNLNESFLNIEKFSHFKASACEIRKLFVSA